MSSAPSGPARSRAPVVVAVAVGLVLIVIVRLLSGAGSSSHHSSSADTPGCTTVHLTASSEKAALLKAVASSYADADHKVDGHCARVAVVSKASGGAEQALARDWDDDTDGVRPDVWSPASSSWAVLLQADRADKDKTDIVPTGPLQSVTQTPLVLAMPRPMAQALGWPDTPIGWGDLLALSRQPSGWGSKGHPEWGQFRLGKTNPTLSTSGLNATIGTYLAATGKSSDLTAADLAKPAVTDFVTGVEKSVVHYGDTTLTFLTNLQAADDAGRGLTYVSAVAVEEKSIWDYDQGNPSGDPATLGKHAKPKVPLVAVYPKEGTLLSDSPYVVLDAPWVTQTTKDVAADFLQFLKTPEQQKAFLQAGFRGADGATLGGRIGLANGTVPTEPKVVLAPPATTVLRQVLTAWTKERKRAHILLVIDVSGSMGDSVGSSGSTRLELAKKAASGVLSQFQADDEVGAWAFTTDLGGANPTHLELAPVAPVGPQLDALRSSIDKLQPLNGTPLYKVTRDAVAAVSSSYDKDKINAVVLLTDGRNEYPQDTDLTGLLRNLAGQQEGDSVRVFTIGYSEGADSDALKKISAASRAAFYDASDPTTIDGVLTNVVSNF